MPVSVNTLTNKLGIDEAVAKLFVNRKMPGNNEYWQNRTGYVSLSTGYIFIPTFFDFLVKQGFKPKVVLDERLLETMENILQSAGRMEYKMIDTTQHINDCRQILFDAHVSADDIKKVEELLVQKPFTKIPSKYSALRRANTFLYTFGGQSLDFDRIFDAWELLVPLMLMLDDFADIQQDIANGEENCLLDAGSIADNFFDLVTCSGRLIQELASVNPALAVYLRGLKEEAVATNMLTIMKSGSR